MIKLPVLWRSGQETSWSACPSGSLETRTLRDGGGNTRETGRTRASKQAAPLHSTHVLSSQLPPGYVRAKLCQLERRPPSRLHQPFLFSSVTRRLPTQCNPSFLKMGNRNSSSSLDRKVSYRSNGVSYEKEDGAAYSIHSKKLEPLRLQGEPPGVKASMQTTGKVAVNVGKPSPLRGGSPGPNSRPDSPVYSQESSSSGYRYWGEPERSPGPGFHNLPATLKGPAYTMSPRLKQPLQAHSPGPGHYSPKLSPSGPAYSIRGRGGVRTQRSLSSSPSRSASPAPNPHADRPGHGCYVKETPRPRKVVNGRIEERKQFTKKKQKKDIDYFIVRVNPDGPAYKITRAGSVMLADQTGPRNSSKDDSKGRSRSPGTSTSRSRSRSRSSSPSRASSISWSPRRMWSPTPGPGEHQRIEYKASGPSVTLKSKLKVPSSKENFPGPGAYNVKPRPGSPSFSIGYRRQVRSDCSKPGPGAYDLQWKPDGPSFSIFGRPKDSPPRSKSPGPAYKYDNNTIGHGLPSFRITGKPKCMPPSKFPGPGTYPSATSPRGPSFTILPKITPRTTRAESPGPGEYNPKTATSSPSFTLKGKAHDPSGAEVPGPGSYTARSGLGGPSFSIHRKISPLSPRSVSPGPGTYKVHSRPTSPSFSIYGQVKRPEGDNFPGPGSYYPKVGKTGPGFSIKGKLESVPKSRSPGPAAYNPEVNSKLSSRSNSPSFSIRKKIGRLERTDSPGPGAYFLPDRTEGPFFSMGRKVGKVSRAVSPGPGAYAAGVFDDIRFPTPPKCSFGVGARM